MYPKQGGHKMKYEQLISISRDMSITFFTNVINIITMWGGMNSSQLMIPVLLLYIVNLLWGINEIIECKNCTLLDIVTIKGKLFGIFQPTKQ